MSLWDRLKRLRKGARGETAVDAGQLRALFSRRYHYFKLLISANNKALEVMSEMEEALRGPRPYGMTYVRAQCARITAAVFQIVRQMDALAPGRYPALAERFEQVRAGIRDATASRGGAVDGELVLCLDKVHAGLVDQAGSKMANLGEVRSRLGLAVPEGFVATAAAFRAFMARDGLQDEIARRIQTADTDRLDRLMALSADLQQLVLRAPLPPELDRALADACGDLAGRAGPGLRLAVRSSALGEDLPGMSFAGQYRSLLNVAPEHLAQAYREVAASLYGLQAMTYRLARGIPDEDVAMCVGCLAMAESRAGGVAYSRSPVDAGDQDVQVHAVFGLPKGVVDGSGNADLYVASRAEPRVLVRREVAAKTSWFAPLPGEGLDRRDLPEQDRSAPCLDDAQALEIARLALAIEAHFGAPQDVEWALGPDGSVTVLQARPLQRMDPSLPGHREARPPEGALLWGGATASPGAGAGPVFKVRKDADAMLFPQGAVLVAEQASPRWAPLLGRAAAVVAEQGSAAGHLANVAREFGVPALLGAAGAMDVLDNGLEVTVDADAGVVLPGRVEELLRPRPEQGVLMRGSPVQAAMERALAWAAPLNLTDPDAPMFRADNCRTLHDITRFCHEKAVEAMFDLDGKDGFPRHGSKQLKHGVPMQFWVLDLDDGFADEVRGKYVTLEQIASIPMLALWRGMVAKPWQGPPPVDSKGFMSVLFEATANRGLDPSMASPYTMKNYFMVSRHFCNLQSRFGFHFVQVEALVGDEPAENYAAMRFKGGAASLDRRVARAEFIAEVLEEHGFRARIREDALAARLEGMDREAMERRLRMLGHLVIHTRQLDMIMADPAARERKRREITDDLRAL